MGYSEGTVTGSYATGSVMGSGSSVGGLVGYNGIDATVMGSYATVSVTGSGFVGGLVGENYATVTASYATGSVTGVFAVGGLVGWVWSGTVAASYATGSATGAADVGGLVGLSLGTVTASYWNKELSGNVNSSGGVGLTTADMFMEGSFAGFDFDGTMDSENNAMRPPMYGYHPSRISTSLTFGGCRKMGKSLAFPALG